MQKQMDRDLQPAALAVAPVAAGAGSQMPARPAILVIDLCPARRCGIVAALAGAGFKAEASQYPAGDHRSPAADVPSVIFYSSDDGDLTAVRGVHRDWPGVPLIVLLPNANSAEYWEMLNSGASAVLPVNAELAELVNAAVGVLSGLVVLPKLAAADQAFAGTPHPPDVMLNDQEVTWLKALAQGATVTHIAHDAGYSERSMYRRLGILYKRLKVRNRTQALLAASERGLLR